MIVLGIVLLLLAALLEVPVLTTLGIILLVVGAALMLASAMGRTIGPRRYYW